MLSEQILSMAIWAKLISKGFMAHNISGVPTSKDFVDAISEAVVEHIKNQAIVNTTVTGVCPTGPVTGTGVGTIS